MDQYLGEIASALAPISWALAVALFARAGRDVSPTILNFLKNLVAAPLILITMLVLGIQVLPALDGWTWFILIVSGFLGMALADTLLLASLNWLGTAWFALVSCMWAPVMVLVTAIGFGESITVPVAIGSALVAVSVLLVRAHDPGATRTSREIFIGITIGLLAQFSMALGLVTLRYPIAGHAPVFETTNVLVVTFWRIVVGIVAMAAWAALHDGPSRLAAALRPSPTWRWVISGGFFGTYIAMIFWIVGMKEISGSMARAAVLNQTTAIYMPLFGWWILRERITRRKVLAITVAFLGATIVVVGR